MTSSEPRTRRIGSVAGIARIVTIASAVGAITLSPTMATAQHRTAADIESARQLYNQGIELREKGDLGGALEKFKAAHALGNTPITGLDLCKAHASLAQPVEAREVCLGVSRIPVGPEETARSRDARAEAARFAEEVRPRIAGVRLHVRGVPSGLVPTVTVDGTPVPPAALDELRALDPGAHDVEARVGAGPVARSSLTLQEGEERDLELVVQAPAEEQAVAAPENGAPWATNKKEKKGSVLATTGFVVAGVGVGVGAIAGLIALSAKNNLDDTCKSKVCGPSDYDELDHGKTWGTASTVLFVIGGAGLATGIVATLVRPSTSTSTGRVAPPPQARIMPVIGPGGMGIHGSF